MVLAHAFGARYDSPVPPLLFVLGGGLVVLASFALVYRRAVAVDAVRPGPDVVRAPTGAAAGGAASALVLAALVAAGLAGSQEVPENILPTAFWLVAWVLLPLLVGLVGDFTGPVNPFAAIARAADSDRLRRAVIARDAVAWPRRVGWWVSVVLYALVVVGELVVNRTATLPWVTATGLAVYAVVCAVGGMVFGAQAWNTRAELFTVMLATWGRLGWFRFGSPGRRGLGGGLDVPFEASPSRVVGVLLLLVSVSFDGLLSTPQWARFSGRLPADLGPGSGGYDVLQVTILLALTLVTLTVFGAFAVAAARAGGHGGSRLLALTGLLPSLLPIAFGYLLSHYVQYVLINGQLLFPLLGNPVGRSWWPLALPYPFSDAYEVNTGIMPTAAVWYLQIVVIIAAHVVAVVLAHRHLVVSAPEERQARRSEWPWLAAMVGYTMVSLWLLSQPLVESAPADAGGQAVVPGVVARVLADVPTVAQVTP